MDPFTVGWIMGGLTGALFGMMATFTYQWWTDRRIRHVELDDYTARLRALDRPQPKKPSPIIVETRPRSSDLSEDEYLMAQLRKANREGWL